MARTKMTLPSDEITLLCGLSPAAQRARARQLYDLGWSLASIGEALVPPRSRSTVRAWVQTAPLTPSLSLPTPPSPSSLSSLSSLSSAASSSTLGTAESLSLDPSASASAPFAAAPGRSPRRAQRRVFDPARPSISPDDARRISELAPLARRYRARANPDGAYALANEELTQLCSTLYDSGTPIRELAHAAGVTYKAMERRVQPRS